MDDSRIFIAIVLLGIGSVVGHVLDLIAWWSQRRPQVIHPQTNGGVKSAWSGTSQTR